MSMATTNLLVEPNSSVELETQRCPANQVAIGFHASIDGPVDPILRSVQAICGELSITGSGPYQLTVEEVSTLGVRGFPSDVAQTVVCPKHQVVTGFAGRSGHAIDGIEIRCSGLEISGSAPEFSISVGLSSPAGSIGSTNTGGPFEAVECEPGQLAVGQLTRSIDYPRYIGSFGVPCASASLTLE